MNATSIPGLLPLPMPPQADQVAASLPPGETPEQALTRAQAAMQGKRFNEAGGICADVLTREPDHPAALALQAMIAALTNDLERGLALMQRAIRLRPGQPNWYAHLSSLYRLTYRLKEAVAAGNESIRLDPNNADHLVNLALVYADMDDRPRAKVCLLRALGLRHDHAEAHFALGQTLLAMGDFAPGWMEYEWRNLTEAGKASLPRLTSMPWNGMAIPTGRLLVVGDQGYGDTIQFARYLPDAAARCQEVVLGGSAELAPLLRNFPGVTHYCQRWDEVPGHAAHCRLSSLPYLFQTRPDAIPAPVPYLAAAPVRVAHWRARLAALLPPNLPRIGLAWTGRPSHPNDRRRSMALESLLPLATSGAAAFVSLQKPVPARDAPLLARFGGMLDLADELSDFGETAVLIASLDLVITVDTGVAHLAGALGKPVWILLSKAADWRWMIDRADSPWYPTARLFRQRTPGAWQPVVADVAAALAERLRAPMRLEQIAGERHRADA